MTVDVAVCFREGRKRFCEHVHETLNNGNGAKFNGEVRKDRPLSVRALQWSITGLPVSGAKRPVNLRRHIRTNMKRIVEQKR